MYDHLTDSRSTTGSTRPSPSTTVSITSTPQTSPSPSTSTNGNILLPYSALYTPTIVPYCRYHLSNIICIIKWLFVC